MHVLAISYLFPNSVTPNAGVFVLNRLKAVSQHVKVTVINPIPWFFFSRYLPRYKNFHKIPEREVIDGIEVYHPRFFIIPKYFKFLDCITFSLAAIPVAIEIRKKNKFDLIDLHWTYPDILAGYMLSRIFGKKLLITIRGQEAYYDSDYSIRKQIIKYLLPKADFVIALSEQLANNAIKYRKTNSNVQVIPNGVDTSNFNYKELASCRSKLGLPLESKIIVSVGSLIYRKGFDRIINSLPRIKESYPNVLLCIVGTEGPEGDYRNRLYQLINENKVQSNIRFIGSVKNKDLVDWYGAADAFCLASRGEGSPNVLMEALASGCPSLTTNVGSVDKVLTEDYMGEVVPNDETLLANPLIRLLGGSFDRRKIAEAMEKYDWDWCARQVIRNYMELRD